MTDDTTIIGGTPAAGADGANPAAGAGDPWFKGADAETIGYLTNRGLDKKSPTEAAFAAINAHRNAEAKLGIPSDQLVRLPKDEGDTATREALFKRLGRPDKADGYDLKYATEHGGTEDFVKFVQNFAFQRGMSKADGEAMAKEFVDFAEKREAGSATETEEKLALERTSLQKDWGFNFDANKLIARNAAIKLGIPPAAVEALEKSAGYAVTMEALRKIGVAIGEARFITSETTGNVMTREGAIERKASLMRDTEWVTKYLAGDTKAVKEMTGLNMIIVGSGS